MAAFTIAALLSCAEDTGASFTGHLLDALQKGPYRTILSVNPQELERTTIEESMMFVVILSVGYLSSLSHLDKLTEIVEELSMGRTGQVLLPFFYNVEPSHVPHQISSYRNIVTPERFEKWALALARVVFMAVPGCHFQRDGGTYEYQCIEKIVQRVSKHVASTIGLNPQVKEVLQRLYSGSDDGVRVVGICEDPRVGKATIARRVYDLIAGEGFDSYCFLNVGENLRGPRFGHFLHMFDSGMVCKNHGMSITKSTLNQMKVFVVFQGLNDPNLLKHVIELTNCFGSGSRVIITSQDRFLLESHGVDRTTLRYLNVIDLAETCSSGHPLALEVIDSNSPEKTIEECKSALDQCKRIPNTDLMMQNMVRENKRIRLSKDILEENKEYGMLDAEHTSNDRSRNCDLMELDYQDCSSSSSLDAL